ncbi:TetR/AcrR family transcriptional regulator [Lentzea sp. JNUCC 0626]|uniref:TetR/AcrR family transcriptional regulator n=1 Tax=Lentzea sp. JNUCC 0626 TaxID=3367513 RepID=UPI0037478711
MDKPSSVRSGRPPLTERRKAETRLEIAREAVRLFAEKGVSATTAEEIAAAAGISLRTLWRYTASKENCVLPLLTTGIDAMAHSLRTWRTEQGVDGLLDDMQRDSGRLISHLSAQLDLVRLTRTEPSLRTVWTQAHADAEPVFAEVLADRLGTSADDLSTRLHAAMINVALRVAVEHHAFHETPTTAEAVFATVREALTPAVRCLEEALPRST